MWTECINYVKGDIELDKVKIEGLEPTVEKLRDGAIYIAGVSAAAKLIKSYCLPIGAKLGPTLGMGASSLIAYKMTHNVLYPQNPQGKITASIDKINVKASSSQSTKNNLICDITDKYNDLDSYNTISSVDIEQLQLDYYLHIILIYLIVIVIVILVMRDLSRLNLNFVFVTKLPYGILIKNILQKLLNWWSKTSNIWLYIILVNVLICLIISCICIYVILGNIK